MPSGHQAWTPPPGGPWRADGSRAGAGLLRRAVGPSRQEAAHVPLEGLTLVFCLFLHLVFYF